MEKNSRAPQSRKDSRTSWTVLEEPQPEKTVSLGAKDVVQPLTTSPAHISWGNQGLQPAFWELQTRGKGYPASQGHELA